MEKTNYGDMFNVGVETMSGSDPNSVYVVLANNKAVKLGIRVFIINASYENSMWVCLGFRLRASSDSFAVSKELAAESFGNFNFYESKEHSSCVGMIPIKKQICSVSEFWEQWKAFKTPPEKHIIDTVKETLATVGVSLCLKEELLTDNILDTITDTLPVPKISILDNPVVVWPK